MLLESQGHDCARVLGKRISPWSILMPNLPIMDYHWKFWTCLILALVPLGSYAQDTLWVARGEWTHIPDSVQALRFNANAQWSGINATLTRPVEATSPLVLVNLDSISHIWKLEVDGELEWELAAQDTIALEMPALPAGAYRFGLTDEIGRVMGGEWSTSDRFGSGLCSFPLEFGRLVSGAHGGR